MPTIAQEMVNEGAFHADITQQVAQVPPEQVKVSAPKEAIVQTVFATAVHLVPQPQAQAHTAKPSVPVEVQEPAEPTQAIIVVMEEL